MSEDILVRLRHLQWIGSDAAKHAADEIERLRAEVEALKQGQEVCANAMNIGADVIDGLKANLTEALRLMEPVASAHEVDMVFSDRFYVDLHFSDALAIADFVKRMKGE